LRKKFKLQNKLIIGIIGISVYAKEWKITRGWELVWLIKEMKDKPVVGMYIGGGSGIPYLKKWANNFGIQEKIIFVDQIPYAEVPKYVSLFDVCLLTMPNHPTSWIRTTGKLTEYLSAGKFIIGANLKGNAKEDVEKVGVLLPYQGGFDQEYINKITSLIKKILKKPEILRKGLNGIKIAREKYDYKILSKRLAKIFYNKLLCLF
jgi:glycosyltransferase involved in cell wall biosynthesis